MNKAQKKTWWTFAISAATLLISASVIAYVWVNQIKLIDVARPMRIRLIGLMNTIPLILIVFVSRRFSKKDYDERDTIIERKSYRIGYITSFVFLVVTGYCLFLMNRSCGKCIERCPIGAITEKGHNKFVCQKYVNMTRQYVPKHYGFNGYGCGFCQTNVPCESGIPESLKPKNVRI